MTFGGDRGREAEIHGELPGFVALVGPIHDEGDVLLESRKAAQKLSTRRGVAPLAGGQREGHGPPIICGNHMNLGAPRPPRERPIDCGPFFFPRPYRPDEPGRSCCRVPRPQPGHE